MTKRILYERQGRRYVPVQEYDSIVMDSLPRGDHLISVYPGGQSTRYNIDPNYAAMIAAARVAEDAICRAISTASELRPRSTPITEGQRRAWKKLAQEFGDELCTLNAVSARDCAEAGVKAMQAQADLLLNTPSVKKAYERFLLVCELTRTDNV